MSALLALRLATVAIGADEAVKASKNALAFAQAMNVAMVKPLGLIWRRWQLPLGGLERVHVKLQTRKATQHSKSHAGFALVAAHLARIV